MGPVFAVERFSMVERQTPKLDIRSVEIGCNGISIDLLELKHKKALIGVDYLRPRFPTIIQSLPSSIHTDTIVLVTA